VATRRSFIAVCLASGLALTACGNDGGSGSTDDPIKIGVVIPSSGTYASEGQEVRRGYEMALADAGGAVNGRKVELVFGDAFAPEDAINEVDRLATREKVNLFVGTYATPASQAGSEAAARHQLAWIETHAITDSLTTRGLDNYIRVGPRAVDFANRSAQFVVEGLAPKLGGKPSVFVEHEDGPYGTSVAETQVADLKKAGLTTTEGAHKTSSTDVTDSVLAAKRANPDVWLITGYAPDSGLLLRTAAAQGFNPKATVLVGAGDTKAVFEAVGAKDLKDTFVVAYTSPIVNPTWATGNEKFYTDYKARFSADPLGTVANTGYTGMTAALKILGGAGGATDVAALGKAAAAVDVPVGQMPNGWGLKLDENRQNTLIRLLAVQWREDGTVPAIWPAEAAGTGQSMQGLG
jgi:branched-chain amino acid transport system substrate-binding protein